jgi:hypothetical protein
MEKFDEKSLLRWKLNALEAYRLGHLDDARALLHDCFDTIDSVDALNTAASPECLDAALWRELCEKVLESEPNFAMLYMVMGSLIYQLESDVVAARCDDQAIGIVSRVPT